MNILIIGSGGREHAIGWKLKQSPHVAKIYFAPGNGGTCWLGENVNIKANDIKELLRFAKKKRIDLTMVGPEDPLAQGIVDIFQKNNLMIFGPTKKATQLESDKAWALRFVKRHHIPHPESYIFNRYQDAIKFINAASWKKMVVKASGLALGKGVIVAGSKDEARQAVEKIMIDKEFGDAGKVVIIQERLYGKEISLLAFTDGKTILPLIPAQDHKRVFDNDKGPNTGGVGAYAPVPFVKKSLLKTIYRKILKPTIDGMAKEGNPYKGVLYAGLMLTVKGPKVLEYNCRFGDPETQPQMILMDDDLVPILLSCIKGGLNKKSIRFKKGASVCVVLASAGYPGHYEKGKKIYGLNKIKNKHIQIIHAGTAITDGKIVTNGGRVLGVTAYGKNLTTAIKRAYSVLNKNRIYFNGMHYRKDIGKKGYGMYH